MSIQDRDWYWEDYKKKETDYDGDFSLHSKKKKESVPPSTPYFSVAQDIVVVPRFCQKCGYKFGIKVREYCILDYSYECPKCGQKVYVTFHKPINIANLLKLTLKVLTYMIGFASICLLIVALLSTIFHFV